MKARLVFAALVIVGTLGLITWAIAREPAPSRRLGRVTELETHRICVASGDERTCARVEQPARIAGFAVGDCVRLTVAEGRLDAIDRSEDCPPERP